MRIASTPTQQQIDDMFARAQVGDPAALEWIYKQNNALSKRANSRLSYLEKQNMETAAYQRAQYYLGEERGSNRFYQGKKGSLEDLQENMEQAAQFLRSQTSTVRGEKKRQERIYDTLEEQGYIEIPEDPKEERAYKKEMNKFLSSDAFNEIKKAFGSGIISSASEIIQAGASVDDLVSLYKQYEESIETDLFQVWDGWREGKRNL